MFLSSFSYYQSNNLDFLWFGQLIFVGRVKKTPSIRIMTHDIGWREIWWTVCITVCINALRKKLLNIMNNSLPWIIRQLSGNIWNNISKTFSNTKHKGAWVNLVYLIIKKCKHFWNWLDSAQYWRKQMLKDKKAINMMFYITFCMQITQTSA